MIVYRPLALSQLNRALFSHFIRRQIHAERRCSPWPNHVFF